MYLPFGTTFLQIMHRRPGKKKCGGDEGHESWVKRRHQTATLAAATSCDEVITLGHAGRCPHVRASRPAIRSERAALLPRYHKAGQNASDDTMHESLSVRLHAGA